MEYEGNQNFATEASFWDIDFKMFFLRNKTQKETLPQPISSSTDSDLKNLPYKETLA